MGTVHMAESRKHALICAVVGESLPQFLCNGSFDKLAEHGHSLVVIQTPDSVDLACELKDCVNLQGIVKCDDSQAGVIAAFNRVVKDHLNWREEDVLLVDGSDCILTAAVIDVMHEETHRFDRYALATPRMNTGGLMSLEESEAEFAKAQLPRITRIPYPLGRCVYFRSEQLVAHGPLDEALPNLTTAVRDYALRVNAFGYDCVMLNHVFVRIAQQRAEDAIPVRDDESGQAILRERYPYLENVLNLFLQGGISPVDRFMPLLVEGDAGHRPSILLNYLCMPPFYCGTSEMQVAFLRHLVDLYADKYDFTVLTVRESAEFHHLHDITPNVVYDANELGVFDLGLCAFHPSTFDPQIPMVNHCARSVYVMLDAIMLRCNYIGAIEMGAAELIRLGLENCDGIVAISEFSKTDTLEYYQDDEAICSKPAKRVYIATDFGTNVDADAGKQVDLSDIIPFEEFVLVAGNDYRHKVLFETIEAVKDDNKNYVVVGYGDNDLVYPNVFGLKGGLIDDDQLFELYRRCSAFVFPSLYEGFGLPITMALKCGKNVVVNNNDLNNELKGHFSEFADSFYQFDTFDEIPGLVEQAAANAPAANAEFCYSWKDAAVELESFFEEVLAKPIDLEALKRRWHQYSIVQGHTAGMIRAAGAAGAGNARLVEVVYQRFVAPHPALREVSHTLGRLRRRLR